MRNVSRIRKIVAALVFVGLAVSLLVHGGSGTLAAIGYDKIALVCPVGQLEVMLAGHQFMLHPAILLVAALLLAVVFGKAFCSWLCPAKYIQKFFSRKAKGNEGADDGESVAAASGVAGDAAAAANVVADGEAAHEVAAVCDTAESSASALPPVGGERDGLHVDSRHGVLIGALASAAIFGFPVFCLVCPVGLTFATFIGLINLIRFNEASWMLLAFPAIVVLELVFFRKWCTSLCPISALLSLVSGANRTFKPSVDHSKCLRGKGVDCRACVEKCPEQVDPHSDMIPECNKCGDCIGACPAHAISVKLLRKVEKGDK